MSDCAVEIQRESSAIRFDVPSRIDLLDSTLHACEFALKDYCPYDLANVLVVLRELLGNAIVHGNKNVDTKLVRGSVERVNEREFMITVADEGNGFNYRDMHPEIPEDPRHAKKRGYILIGHIAHAVLFNAKGNCVTAWVTVGKGPAAPVHEHAGEAQERRGGYAGEGSSTTQRELQ